MRTGRHRAHEDVQVHDIDVFYNGNLIVAEFFSRVLFKVFLQYYICSSVVCDILQLKELINEFTSHNTSCMQCTCAESVKVMDQAQ